jgi:hypothetical protein
MSAVRGRDGAGRAAVALPLGVGLNGESLTNIP